MNNSSMTKNISIIGCSGAIGSAFTNQLSVLYPDATIHAFSRDRQEQIFPNLIHHIIDYQDVISIEESALVASKDAPP